MPPKRDLSEFNYGAMSSLVVNQGAYFTVDLSSSGSRADFRPLSMIKREDIDVTMNQPARPNLWSEESISRIWEPGREERHPRIWRRRNRSRL
jgi:hypothetical protein